MSGEVERVARLMFDACPVDSIAPGTWEALSEIERGYWRAMARAVVADTAALLRKYEAEHVIRECAKWQYETTCGSHHWRPDQECTCGLAARLAG